MESKTAKNIQTLIESGKVRNHKLTNSARQHTGEEEKEEMRVFRDFLIGQNGCLLFALKGHE